MKEKGGKKIEAVGTSFAILETLSEMEPVGVTSLSEQLDIPTSTAHVHLNTLLSLDYVVKETGKYSRSLKFLKIGGEVRQKTGITTQIRKKVDSIAYKTGEIAGAGTEERGWRVMLYRNAGRIAAADEIPVGKHDHLHWTSLGKVLLAHLSSDHRRAIIEHHQLPSGTTQTIDSPSALDEELADIRRQGYAIDDEEHFQGIRGIAVPILDADQKPVASIGVTGPRDRFTPSYISAILDELESARNEIEIQGKLYQ